MVCRHTLRGIFIFAYKRAREENLLSPRVTLISRIYSGSREYKIPSYIFRASPGEELVPDRPIGRVERYRLVPTVRGDLHLSVGFSVLLQSKAGRACVVRNKRVAHV